MPRPLSPKDILQRYGRQGWSPAQIEKRTGMSKGLQTRVLSGRSSGKTWAPALRETNRRDTGRGPGEGKRSRGATRFNYRTSRTSEGYMSGTRGGKPYKEQLKKAKARGVSKREFDDLAREVQRQRKAGELDSSPDGKHAQLLRAMGRRKEQDTQPVGESP